MRDQTSLRYHPILRDNTTRWVQLVEQVELIETEAIEFMDK